MKTSSRSPQKLGVEHVLQGSVSKAGDAVKITAQLIDPQDGFTLWSDSYSRKLDDIFHIQEDIARSVAAALRVTLGLKEEKEVSVMLGGTADIRAYDLYLSARALLNGVGRGGADRDSVQKSLKQIQGAIDRDDKFALAWVLKSKAHDAAQIYLAEDVISHRDQAEDAARRAYALEPNLPQAHLELAFKLAGRLKWTAAEEEFTLARALGLSDDEMGQYAYVLVNTGRIRRARDIFLVSQASDPLNANLFMYLLITYDILGDTDEALEFYDRGKALFANWPAGDFNAIVALWGRSERAGVRARAKSIAAQFRSPVFDAVNPVYDSPQAARDELRKLYADPTYRDPISRIAIAASAAYFDDAQLALNALVDASKAVPLYAHKFWQPLFSEVRKLPEFKDFMRTGGFLDYWHGYGWPDQCRPDGADFACRLASQHGSTRVRSSQLIDRAVHSARSCRTSKLWTRNRTASS